MMRLSLPTIPKYGWILIAVDTVIAVALGVHFATVWNGTSHPSGSTSAGPLTLPALHALPATARGPESAQPLLCWTPQVDADLYHIRVEGPYPVRRTIYAAHVVETSAGQDCARVQVRAGFSYRWSVLATAGGFQPDRSNWASLVVQHGATPPSTPTPGPSSTAAAATHRAASPTVIPTVTNTPRPTPTDTATPLPATRIPTPRTAHHAGASATSGHHRTKASTSSPHRAAATAPTSVPPPASAAPWPTPTPPRAISTPAPTRAAPTLPPTSTPGPVPTTTAVIEATSRPAPTVTPQEGVQRLATVTPVP